MNTKAYYHLMKPGIVYGNALAATAGFFLGSWFGVDWFTLVAMLVGLSGIIASACILNNFADRDIDAHMERTKKRGLVVRTVSDSFAIALAAVLGVGGVLVLFFFTNMLALLIALIGFFVYVFAYTPLKRRSSTALYIGAIAGATPPVVGYVAAAELVDIWALLLFVGMFVWQLPHFIAIALYRFHDYAAAGIPLVVKKAPQTEKGRKIARTTFIYSQILLLVFCLAIVFWRLLL